MQTERRRRRKKKKKQKQLQRQGAGRGQASQRRGDEATPTVGAAQVAMTQGEKSREARSERERAAQAKRNRHGKPVAAAEEGCRLARAATAMYGGSQAGCTVAPRK